MLLPNGKVTQLQHPACFHHYISPRTENIIVILGDRWWPQAANQAGNKISLFFHCNTWKQRNERAIVGGGSSRSRNGAPSRKGFEVKGQMTKASNISVCLPPSQPRPPPPPALATLSFVRRGLHPRTCYLHSLMIVIVKYLTDPWYAIFKEWDELAFHSEEVSDDGNTADLVVRRK